MRYFIDEKFKFLDTIDLDDLINETIDNSYTVYDLMDKIEDRYCEQYGKEDFIFNNINALEFMNYLRDVYDVKFREIVNYWGIINYYPER